MVEGKSKRRGSAESFEQWVLRVRPELDLAQFEKVLRPDGLVQSRGIMHQKAADHIGFLKAGGGYHALISEITEGNKPLDRLKSQFEGGKKVAMGDRSLGHLVTKYIYRVFTNSEDLRKALAAKKNALKIDGNSVDVEIILVGG